MEYNANNAPDAGIDLQTIAQYAKRVALKWWAVLLSAIIFAGIGFGVAKLNYQPMYSCTMRFVVDNKSENTVTGGINSSDISAGISLAINYKQIMTETNTLMQLVADGSGYDITANEVKGMISANLEEETSIIKLTITTSDPEVSYAVAQSYVKNYSSVTEKAYQNTRAIVIDDAIMPTQANPDNSVVLYTLLGFIFGAGAVVFAICMNIFIKDTVKTPDDVSRKLETKVIGSVVSIKKNEKKRDRNKKSLLITDKSTGFMFIESFKLIRTKIENISKRQGYKTFIITSASENEGKTTTAVNTALALAKAGKSVLLIDADLRKPAVYKALGVSATNETGLAGIVKGEKTLSDSIKYFEKFNLFLLITSQPVSESTELLSSDEMAETIEAVKNEFDYVVIDTPPGGIVADASILAQYDACIMVVRHDHAPLRRIRRTMEDVSGAGIEIIGCVFNDAETGVASKFIKSSKKRKKAYGYGYDYGYGYGYGYSDDKKNK